MGEDRDARAERLLSLGLDVAVRLRDEDPADVRRAVDALPVDEVRDLVLLLAACVPVDVPAHALLGWWRHPPRVDERPPCGSRRAARRHRARGEPVDALCRWAELETERVRGRERRAA